MSDAQSGPSKAADNLRTDLGREYFAIMSVVSEFDGRAMTIKGWSVTLSLTGIGLAFSQGHYALFALAGTTALAFWFMEILLKRHQMQYYSRMRDIEVAAYYLNHLKLEARIVSSPKVDWSWAYTGRQTLPDIPKPRDPQNIERMLAQAPWMPHVFLPHGVAILLGFTLFALALMNVAGLGNMVP